MNNDSNQPLTNDNNSTLGENEKPPEFKLPSGDHDAEGSAKQSINSKLAPVDDPTMSENKGPSTKFELPPVEDHLINEHIKRPRLRDRIINLDFDVSSKIPMITILLVLFGAFNTYHYYSLFGINVVPFLEPTELIFAFANTLPWVFMVLILFILILGTFYVFYLINPDQWSRQNALKLLFQIFCFGWFTFWGFEMAISLFSIDLWDVIWLSILTGVLVFVLGDPLKIFSNLSKFLIAFVGITFFIVQQNKTKFDQITIKHHNQYDVYLSLQDTTIRTTEQILYLGTTKGYIFFWDAKEKRSTVFPLANVQSLNINKTIKEDK